MTRTTAFRFRSMPAAALLACLAMAGAAQAQVTVESMAARGSYSLDGALATTLLQTSAFGVPSTVDVLSFPGNFGSSSAGLHSYGDTSGSFGSRSSGSGIYEVTGGFNIQLKITNGSASAQSAKFSFYITPGLLSNELAGYQNQVLTVQAATAAPIVAIPGPGGTPPAPITNPFTGAQFVEAGTVFNIQKNGSTVWDSSALLRTDVNGTTFTQTGTNLYSGSGTYRSIAGGAFEVDLGVLAAGETIDLNYDLSTVARGDAAAGNQPILVPEQTIVVPDQWVEFCQGAAYGYACSPELVPGSTIVIPEHTLQPAPSGSQASSGDPFDVYFDGTQQVVNIKSFQAASLPQGLPQGFSVALSNPVPEPASYGLMAAGLLAVGAVARRRRRSTQG